MSSELYKTISFKLKESVESIEVDFWQFDLDLLSQIARVLDINEFNDPLCIKIDSQLYAEAGAFLAQNHWCLNFADHIDSDGYNILINGFQLIFKKQTE